VVGQFESISEKLSDTKIIVNVTSHDEYVQEIEN